MESYSTNNNIKLPTIINDNIPPISTPKDIFNIYNNIKSLLYQYNTINTRNNKLNNDTNDVNNSTQI